MHMIIYSLFWDDDSFVYKQPQYVYMFIYICIYLKMYIYIYVCMYVYMKCFQHGREAQCFCTGPNRLKSTYRHLKSYVCVCTLA